MAFWAENFGDDASLRDPKRNFRFKVEFSNVDSKTGGPILWFAKSVNKPSFTVATSEHKYLNHTFYYPGSVTWNEITIELVDPVDPDVAATISSIVQESGYAPPSYVNSLGTMSKAGAASSLGQVFISQIDGTGQTIEKWTLWNAFVQDVKYGDLEYGNDELTSISVVLRYDWARLETTTAGSVTAGGAGIQNFFTPDGSSV